ncbi:3-dehydroquinate synthase II [Methanospirillum hungatei]|jgi:3-dehydroquinate synthase II|uniref:3-dehydroquinate synthase II n=1 Tax=Methanospirillum hungatei TaxID=2203 RepID=UPI0009CA1D20|nr:3-dehydroquinate synthase II [Methanospirillum hungatei]MBP7034160.1 3-dehydroquinate synthase II [Methanospirillum sp.]MBP9008174.1 3-dehydroquinate synthase II [Methanospirillum sp.]OQA60368.1 MAG: 3-dehydroquinate synthase [Euryarchaeota archaeon ADurb.Bin294]HOW05126.1 3-dehydroquinate synthase II [Methanospirillum hungatei]
MKQVFVDLRPWDKELAIAALESGATGVIAESAGPVRELGRILVIAPDGDLIPGQDIHEITIGNTEDQARAMEAARTCRIIVHTPDWTIIPLENLVACGDNVIAVVSDIKEAEQALTVLEKGVSGVLVRTDDPDLVRSVCRMVQSGISGQQLHRLTVTTVKPAGMGERVCVDTCSLMVDGEGMLVGNTSSGFFLVHAETLVNPYVAPRPFRVNAGGVHAYLQVVEGKTAYLADLKAGDRVMIVHGNGSCREATVGRVKIERRPLFLVEAESEGQKVSIILQNAETIRLVRPDYSAVSVTSLKPGDVVLGRVESGGRHFGMAIDETIIEK